ncbi:MAG: hypothetical protein SH848_17650 [Saprospiraceae bacterium]|nr:hypothetical protein [Saprospiraceae bacterium]MDZ4705756.1 hypothetical protein [Saprospiraceae bacterium]
MANSNIDSNSKCYSYHVFIFPFRWRLANTGNKRNISFQQKVQLDAIRAAISSTGDSWSAVKFDIKPTAPFFNSYNEYSYFHDYVRDALGVNYKAIPGESSMVMEQYEYRIKGVNPQYQIEIRQNDQVLTFALSIKSITLHCYESGVGALSFHLENRTYSDFNQILKINDFGRRIYPQFIGGNYDESNIDEKGNPKVSSLLHGSQNVFLPLKIVLANVGSATVEEDFKHYAQKDSVAQAPFVLPAHINTLLGNKFITRFQPQSKGDIVITPALDDRMFLMCLTFNSDLLENLGLYQEIEQRYKWDNSDDWYRYIFVDGDKNPTIANRFMKQGLLKSATYDRWVELYDQDQKYAGQLYGISRYSFVGLVADNWFNENIIYHHFSNHYFQLSLLALMQRASVLSFSAEAAWISDHLPKARSLRATTIDNIADLYLAYMKFVQKMYFREVTPQEQGLELYNLLQAQLNIKENVEDIEREMGELNRFVEAQQQRSISIITYWFFPATIMLSFFGIGYFSKDGIHFDPSGKFHWGINENSVLIIIVMTILLTIIFRLLAIRK